MTGSPGMERRRAQRQACALDCAMMERQGGRGFIEHPARVVEISQEGCFVATSRRPRPGSELGLRIRHLEPGEPDLRLFGTVVHLERPGGFGLSFTTMSPQVRERLVGLLRLIRARELERSGAYRMVQAEEARKATFQLEAQEEETIGVSSTEIPGLRPPGRKGS